ncbi:MAG: DUF1614 domain-containing protein [Dethiobacteria bacterium]|jgi:hypothetical protein|nr:DUF1614 domain-containing protein [Bacillota bacterium]
MFIGSARMLLLAIVAALVYLGLLHRVLDRMRLTKAGALLILLAMAIASFLPELPLGFGLSVNIGGMLIPLAICIYLIIVADSREEKFRGLAAAGVTLLVVWSINHLFPVDPVFFPLNIDPLFLPSIVAGLTAYIIGRSRRASFIGAVLGVLFLDLAAWLENIYRGQYTVPVVLGGAGIYSAAVIAGLLAVFLAEVIGEVRERLGGGPSNA